MKWSYEWMIQLSVLLWTRWRGMDDQDQLVGEQVPHHMKLVTIWFFHPWPSDSLGPHLLAHKQSSLSEVKHKLFLWFFFHSSLLTCEWMEVSLSVIQLKAGQRATLYLSHSHTCLCSFCLHHWSDGWIRCIFTQPKGEVTKHGTISNLHRANMVTQFDTSAPSPHPCWGVRENITLTLYCTESLTLTLQVLSLLVCYQGRKWCTLPP